MGGTVDRDSFGVLVVAGSADTIAATGALTGSRFCHDPSAEIVRSGIGNLVATCLRALMPVVILVACPLSVVGMGRLGFHILSVRVALAALIAE